MFRKYAYIFCLLLFVPSLALAQGWFTEANTYLLNDVHFELEPLVTIRQAQMQHSDLSFDVHSTSFADSVIIRYTHPLMEFDVKVKENQAFHAPAKQVEVCARYFDEIYIRDFGLKLNFTQRQPQLVLRGPEAISQRDPKLNQALYPYTDKVIEYEFEDSSLWIVGSNYAGCANLDWISEDTIWLYDNSLHFARRYSPELNHFDTLQDTMKRHAGDENYYSFLIFESKPALLKINRWLGDKKAALVLTNDADGEGFKRMQAVYFGSSNPNSPKYLNQGIFANNIKLTNTVFGASKPVLGGLWSSLMDHGISIGYHTFGNTADLSHQTYQNLIHEMGEYNIRTWIDHSWGNNPEDLCAQGWNPESEYYILDAINDSNIDYFWLGDAPYTNPINSFTEPWRLPHRLYEFDHLTRPMWFYGRTKMGTWEATEIGYLSDLKHQLTAENLDRLLNENGLCVVYTHFFFDQTLALIPFYQILPNGDYEIREDVNDRLALLDYYQTCRGLWIDTLEQVFDRMIAMEDLRIVSSEKEADKLIVRLENQSDYDLRQIHIIYDEESHDIDLIPAQVSQNMFLSESHYEPGAPFLDIFAYYHTGKLTLKHKAQDSLPLLDIDIYNIRGQKLKSFHMQNASREVTIPFFANASGMYILRLKTRSGFSKTIRVPVVK
ncbi:MAG: T9SS type A sorting domain-containing protein [Candidatus Cloacimonetes bacterium]|jgi:hypothetical protein|nr:T9SS type A sorting domain-containing protein [Candidatus Cloacimonadota bacterium]MCK9583613.1 T9SS type A sorting domain-containing protein [Candidatus Cloacimonadota bacterium]MDY0228891.1 T9SS type A sorting domain-containing protein [Candidatus Cloacimonadaceae bacterium]